MTMTWRTSVRPGCFCTATQRCLFHADPRVRKEIYQRERRLARPAYLPTCVGALAEEGA